MEIREWLKLDKTTRHPTPKNIYDMKIESGLGWGEFEKTFENNYNIGI